MPKALSWSQENCERYDAYVKETVLTAYRLATLLPMFLHPVGIYLDWYTHRNQFAYLATIRILSSLGCGFMFFLSRFLFVKKHPFLMIVLHFAAVSSSITAMILALEGYQSPYYAGINLIILVAGILLPKTSQIIVSALVTLACYYVPVLMQVHFKIEHSDIFINNLSFFIWTTFLTLGCGLLKERLLKESFSRLLSLEEGKKKLARAHAKLQDAEEQRTRFFANISHEFRTPLTLILEHSRKLKESKNSLAEERSLELIINQSRLILRHVNDLLDIAKVAAGKQSFCAQKIDLAVHLRKSLEMFNVVAAERSLIFQVNMPRSLPAIVDPDKVERIALNLVSNAFKFCPDGSTISVFLEGTHNGAVLVVEDDGPGVPEHLCSKIFDRFQQGDAVDTRRHGGTGLGLAIVKEFAELHNGKAWVEKSKSGGAKFQVELVFSNNVSSLAERDNANHLLAESHHSLLNELLPPSQLRVLPGSDPSITNTLFKPLGRILIIEDSIDLNHFLADALSPYYQIEVAYDGQQGLTKAFETKPDLILCDIMMPHLSGSDVLRALRQNSEFQHTAFILLTAKADDDLRVRLLSEGADDYIMKPFVMAEVLARVKNLISIKLSRDLLLKSLDLKTGDLQTVTSEVVKQKLQLEHLCECLELARDQAELSYRAKSRFLSLVSHEFKTPVTVFEMSLQLLKRERQSALTELEKREYERASRASVQLVSLVDTLLAYSQFENGDLKFEVEKFNIFETIQELVDIFTAKAQQKGLKLNFSKNYSEQLFLQTDSKMFRLILLNLFENALKYTFAGSIDVFCESLPLGVQVTVKDTGLGIPYEKQHAVFEPFEQLQGSSLKKPPGLGLGLSLVKELLAALEGQITMKSEPGVGSAFTVFLPYHLSSAAMVRRTV